MDTGTDALRRRILDTARHLLVSDGYAALSMRKIAGAIGYSATSIYLHFAGKDALVHALIDEGMARLHERLAAVVEAHPDDPVACLRALCRAYIAFGVDNPEYYDIMFMLRPERMERYPAEKFRRARRNLDLIADVLAAGDEAGVLEAGVPRVAASALWAQLHGTASLMLARRIDIRIEADDLVDAVVEHAVRGFLPLVPRATHAVSPS